MESTEKSRDGRSSSQGEKGLIDRLPLLHGEQARMTLPAATFRVPAGVSGYEFAGVETAIFALLASSTTSLAAHADAADSAVTVAEPAGDHASELSFFEFDVSDVAIKPRSVDYSSVKKRDKVPTLPSSESDSSRPPFEREQRSDHDNEQFSDHSNVTGADRIPVRPLAPVWTESSPQGQPSVDEASGGTPLVTKNQGRIESSARGSASSGAVSESLSSGFFSKQRGNADRTDSSGSVDSSTQIKQPIIDTLISETNSQLDASRSPDIETLVYSGRDNATLVGNAKDNVLIGGSGNDSIRGGAGNDLMIGGAGADMFVFEAGDGFDQILDFSAADKIQLLGAVSLSDVSVTADPVGTQLRYGTTVVDLVGATGLVVSSDWLILSR